MWVSENGSPHINSPQNWTHIYVETTGFWLRARENALRLWVQTMFLKVKLITEVVVENYHAKSVLGSGIQ